MPNDVTPQTESAAPAPAPAQEPAVAAPASPPEVEGTSKVVVESDADKKAAEEKAAADKKAADEKAEADYQTRREKDNIAASEAAMAKWAEDSRNDKEIGGEQFEANLAVAKKGLDQFFPELKEHLDVTGLGNHPAVIKGFLRIGKAISQDKFLPSGTAPAGSKPTTAVFYDKTAR